MLKKPVPVIIIFVLFFCFAEGESLELPAKKMNHYPVADGYVCENTGENKGYETELLVGFQNSDHSARMKSAIRFDVSALTENAKIIEAYLYAYSIDAKPSWDYRSVKAYTAAHSWNEDHMDWAQIDDISARYYDSSCISGIPGSSPDLYLWDITDVVQSWVNGDPNFGIVLQFDADGFDDYLRFYSSENLLFKPYLSVTYTLPAVSEPAILLSEDITADLDITSDIRSDIKTDTDENSIQKQQASADESFIPSDSKQISAEDKIIPDSDPAALSNVIPEKTQPPPVLTPPVFTTHPQSQLKENGQAVSFSVSASGSSPLSFQWIKDGVDIDGETSATYQIDAVSENDEGFFTCRVSNAAGSKESKAAELYVTLQPTAETEKEPPAVSRLQPDGSGADEISDKQPALSMTDLSIKAPPRQGPYVRNGNTLIFSGTAPPHSSLISACLIDNQGGVIRDVSKGLSADPDSGAISGSAFVGSLRGSTSVRLKVAVQDETGKNRLYGISNTLAVDNSYPEIRVTEPVNQSYFKNAPITLAGVASDSLSGIKFVEVSIDGGSTYSHVDSFENGRWQHAFTPPAAATTIIIKAKSTDAVGLETVSEYLTIYYNAPAAASKNQKITSTKIKEKPHKKQSNPPINSGIYTYRVLDIENSRFYPAEKFSLKEEMAIIVKGYGGNMVTVKIIMPSSGKVVFELVDFIPADKHKMWKWKLSQTGTFQAALFVDGNKKDDVFFKIVQ